MTDHFNIAIAKTRLSELIQRVESTGEEIVLTRRGKPVARITPEHSKGPRTLGFAKIALHSGWDKPITIEDFLGR